MNTRTLLEDLVAAKIRLDALRAMATMPVVGSADALLNLLLSGIQRAADPDLVAALLKADIYAPLVAAADEGADA